MVALWAALATVPVLIAMYLLKLRRRTVDVSSTLLWRRAVQDVRANAPFQKLRINPMLLVQLAALGALLAAAAQPELPAGVQLGRRAIILIARSASMGAIDPGAGGMSRLDLAKQRAIELVESGAGSGPLGTGPASQVMVIAFGSRAEILTPYTSDTDSLRRAIESIVQSDAPGSIDQAVRLASARAPTPDTPSEQPSSDGRTPGPRIHLFSDAQLGDDRSALDPIADLLVLHRIGARESENLGIVALRAERSTLDPNRVSLFVGVQSTADEPRDIEIQIQAERMIRLYPLTVPGLTRTARSEFRAGEASIAVEMLHPAPGRVRVSLTGDAAESDALDADNSGWIVLGPPRRIRVACVTPGNVFLRAALEGLGLAELDFFEPDGFAATLASGEASGYDVLVMDRWLPEDERGRSVLAPGASLVFGAVPEDQPGVESLGPGRGGPLVTLAAGHRAMRDVALGGIELGESLAVRLDQRSGTRVLAESGSGPAIFELSEDGSRAIVAAFDPLESTWPWDVSYPLFVASAIESLAGRAGGSAAPIHTGGTAIVRLPPGARDVSLRPQETSSDHQIREIDPDRAGFASIGPIDHAGLYTLSWSGEPAAGDRVRSGTSQRWIAINLLSPSESDTRARDVIETTTGLIEGVTGSESGRRIRLWRWLILTAIAALSLEWWIAHRRLLA